MRGITVGGVHTYDDLGLLLVESEIGSPSVKTRMIDIEGADGALDYTDFFGEPKYENVTHKFTFLSIKRTQAEYLTQFSRVKNALHGKQARIVLDDDTSSYYWGRCYVSPLSGVDLERSVNIECECEPYKYKMAQTVVTQTVSGAASIILTNARKRVVPSITATAAFTIGFRGGSYSRSAGTYTIPEIELVEGDNALIVTGSGTITFRWREGNL